MCTHRGRELRIHVENMLREFGIVDYVFSICGSGHQDVRFTHGGRDRRLIFSASPSDGRAHMNVRTNLKAMLR